MELRLWLEQTDQFVALEGRREEGPLSLILICFYIHFCLVGFGGSHQWIHWNMVEEALVLLDP